MATATERVRNYRDRKRRGVEVVSIEVDGPTICALNYKEYLDDDVIDRDGNCTDKAVLAEAIQTKLHDWTDEALEEFEDAEAAGEI